MRSSQASRRSCRFPAQPVRVIMTLARSTTRRLQYQGRRQPLARLSWGRRHADSGRWSDDGAHVHVVQKAWQTQLRKDWAPTLQDRAKPPKEARRCPIPEHC
jgi:hypothetical protein